MPRHIVVGDIVKLATDNYFNAIIHGCNCFHTMDAGVARQIAHAFPEAVTADKDTIRGQRTKLGHISVGRANNVLIINAYTQFNPGADFRLDALEDAFLTIRNLYFHLRIAYPKIGAGIGGGNWDDIQRAIDSIFIGMDHTLVEYKP